MDKTGWAAEERRSFADLLAGLDDDQWNALSICGDWRVRDVAVHIVAYLDRNRASFFAGMARHYGRIDGLNAADLRRLLTECMIHHQDVRRSLHLPRTVSAGPLRAALDFARIAPLIRGAVRTRGLQMVATDLDWAAWRGPDVKGPGEAVLMAMAGRPDALPHLSGPGVGELSRRFGAGAR